MNPPSGASAGTARGQLTRVKVIAAASRCFVEHGYVATTMAEVAATAGVTVQTLYLRFGSKVALLAAAHDVALVGDDEPVPVLQRAWATQLHHEPDGLTALGLLVDHLAEMNHRVSHLYGAIQAASADPDVAALLSDLRRQQLQTLAAFAETLATKRGYRSDVDTGRATDVLYALAGVEAHRLLVHDRHWHHQEWTSWVTRLLTDQLYAPT